MDWLANSRGNSIVQLCITYLRNFMQLMRVPAFAPYKWFCTNHLAPFQCIFLCLTYLQYNRDCNNRPLIRYFVDEVIDIFASPGVDTTPSNKQVPLAWRMLVTLRNRVDLPLGAGQPQFKHTIPMRCETLPTATALRIMSLSTTETVTDPLIRGAESPPSGWLTSQSTSNGSQLQSVEPLIGHGQHEGPAGNIDMDNVLDISDLSAWSSSLIQDPDEYFHLSHDNINGLNGGANPLIGWNMYSQAPV